MHVEIHEEKAEIGRLRRKKTKQNKRVISECVEWEKQGMGGNDRKEKEKK